MNLMKAVIMAGGEGTRLRPLTCNRPKPMVPVVNKPVMEHIIELLKKHDITEVAATLQYMPEIIKDYFGDGSEFNIELRYYVEEKPLGTAGSVKNAEDFLDDTFVVISGDALTDIDLTEAIEFHRKKDAMATLVLKKVDIPLEYGVVVTDAEGRIIRFLEKPSWGEVFSDTVNTGIYILSPEIFNFYKKNEITDFSKDIFPMLLEQKKPMFGYVADGYWCDIGDLNAYLQAHRDIMDGKVQINIEGRQIKDKVWIGEDTQIDDYDNIKAPCIIGSNCRIHGDTIIGEYSVIGNSNIIGERTGIKRSIIWKNCLLDKNVQLRGGVICDKVHFKDNTSLFENSVIGDGTIVRENAVIKPNIKIWPDKIIDSGAEINSNLVWGTKVTKTIFGHRGIAGEINVDITPEYASKLGAAYGAIMKRDSRIAVSCDDSNAAEMIKMSFISGLLSAGMNIYDFGTTLLPVTRSAVRFYKADGGIHISTSTDSNVKLCIDFLDEKGCNIKRSLERKIENAFIREDFNRCEGDCISNIVKIPDYTKFYARNIINSFKAGKLSYKICLNTRSKLVKNITREILEETGCKVEFFEPLNKYSDMENMDGMGVRNFSSYIATRHYDLGVAMEDTSEKMMLVDHTGRIVTEDMFLALISIILLKKAQCSTIIAPISASHVLEQIAEENEGKIIRTKTSEQDIMSAILSDEIKEDMLDQFTLHFDAMAGLVKILDFMKTNNYSLADLIDIIPDFHIIKRTVECSWNAKGRVIRKLMEDKDAEKIETLEGVKIYEDQGWVLVLPDAEKPMCRVISEGYSTEFAEELASIYENKIREISRE